MHRICFLNRNKLFGRQIPDGIRNFDCGDDMYDLFYLNENVFKNCLRAMYKKRKLKQTSCRESIFNANAVDECYFDLQNILR